MWWTVDMPKRNGSTTLILCILYIVKCLTLINTASCGTYMPMAVLIRANLSLYLVRNVCPEGIKPALIGTNNAH